MSSITSKLGKDKKFDEIYAKYKASIGWNTTEIKTIKSNDNELTVVAGDLHAPFQHDAAIKQMIKDTSKRARRLIIAGDLADMFNMSKYAKFKSSYSTKEELISVQSLLTLLAESYPEVILMRGNHDDRFIKYLQRAGLPPEVLEAFDYLHGEYSLHPIYVLAQGLNNVKIVDPLKKDNAEFCYLYQQGDCIISHAELFSQIPNKTVGSVIQGLKSYHEPEGLVKPFRLVIQAHTHQAGKTWCDFNIVGIENGCLCTTPDYASNARMMPRRASVLGYTELWQDKKGRTDLVKTNFIPYVK